MSVRTVILKKAIDFEYARVGITKEECEEIQALMRLKVEDSEQYPFITDVEGAGHVSEVTESILKEYITEYHTWKIKNENNNRTTDLVEFTCYSRKDRNPYKFSSNVIIHEDRLSAFRGACMGINAHYFYIVKRSFKYAKLSAQEVKTLETPYIEPIKNEIEDECTTDDNNDSSICSENQSE